MKLIPLKEMLPGVRYIVAKGTSCKTLQKGDHIKRGPNGDIDCIEAGGWLENSACRRFRALVQLDTEFYRYRIQKCREEIQNAKHLLNEDRNP